MIEAIDIPNLLPLAMDERLVWTVGLSIGIFASLSMFLASLFAQSGEAQLSPQREIAIATGHTDRRTLFENPYLRQIMWLLLSLCHRMAIPKAKAWVDRHLVAAGNPNYYTAEEYLAQSLFTGLVLGGFMGVLFLLVGGEFNLLLIMVGVAAGATLTVYQLYFSAAKRMQVITRRLPYALDLVSLAMGAGATFTEALHTIVREQEEDPLNVEFKAVLAEIELGTTRRKALMNLAERAPLEGMRSIVASIIQAEELGTPLHRVLHDQATLMRLQRSVRAENAAAKASVRILIPCLLIVMSVILAIFGPMIVRGLRHGLF
jgi:tight adherence protein C